MNRIKELRKEKGFTAMELAHKIGISQSSLTRYENYDVNISDGLIWERMAAIFGVSQGHLMGIAVDFPSGEEELTQEMIMEISKQPVNIRLNSKLEVEIIQSLFMLNEVGKRRIVEDMREMVAYKEYENWWGE